VRVVPGNEAAHSRPTVLIGREAHIGVGSPRSTTERMQPTSSALLDWLESPAT
jgi:hypothetical protein